MDHSCEKCGATVEDGRPFCPQCRAPQIHVQIAIPAGEADATIEALPEQAVRIPLPADFARPRALRPSLFERGVAVRAALKAGVLGGFLSWLISLLGFVLAGALAVYFYRRERGLAPTPGVASRLGGAAGVVSFAVYYLVLVVWLYAMHAQQAYVEILLKSAQTLGYSTGDPDIEAAAHFLVTPSGLALAFFFGMLFAVALAALGGVVAAAVTRRSAGG